MSARPQILVVGEIERSEFAPIRAWLRQVKSEARAEQLVCLASDNATPPDLVIVCQSWPDEFSASEVTAALGRWPLALWAVCYGDWCASDGRNRTIWPLSVRVPLANASARLEHLWQIVRSQVGAPLPLTASRDEIFAFDALTPIGN